jgi:type II secretory pathway component GspD/PulD (secretin)
MRSPLVWAVLFGILVVCPPRPVRATPGEPFYFEDAEVSTVVKHVGKITGLTFLFDPEQVKGRITVLSPKSVSPTEALELLKSALAFHLWPSGGR